MKRFIEMAWRWMRKPRVTPLTIVVLIALNWVTKTSVGHWGASTVSRACYVVAGLSFVGLVVVVAIAQWRRTPTKTFPARDETTTAETTEESK